VTMSLEVFHVYVNKMLLLVLFRYDENLKHEAVSQLSEVRSYLIFIVCSMLFDLSKLTVYFYLTGAR
jgi:hypothetical protein